MRWISSHYVTENWEGQPATMAFFSDVTEHRAVTEALQRSEAHYKAVVENVGEAVWGADYYGYENSLGVHIRHLREKLEPEPGRPRFLQTVRGIGYKLAKEDAR